MLDENTPEDSINLYLESYIKFKYIPYTLRNRKLPAYSSVPIARQKGSKLNSFKNIDSSYA